VGVYVYPWFDAQNQVQLKPDAKIDLQADATSEDPFPHQQAGEHCTRQRRTSESIQLLEYHVISGTLGQSLKRNLKTGASRNR
jgi:hypothetical protein